MNRGKKAIILLSIFLVIGAVLTHLYLPSLNKIESDLFSAKRVESYIEAISREPHSIHHPVERAVVRDYISNQLEYFGYNVQRFKYDSIIDRFGNYIEIENLYTQKDPINISDSTTYILLIAHIDSRFKHPVRDSLVLSLGAADDGYGVGVILEIADLVSRDTSNWKNGIKILLTDSEESNLEGISCAYSNNKELFKNVVLAINIEARGVKGPAILFETSNRNRELIKFYSKSSNSQFGYSMTSAIYNILPNFTDFTVIKDSINGFNFSVIDNLDYYHTDKDNFNNINLSSIQHYGEQIYPMVLNYLTQNPILNSDHFTSSSNSVYFTIPFVGFFCFSESFYIFLSLLFFSLFILTHYIYFIQKRVFSRKIIISLLSNIIFIASISIISFFIIKHISNADGISFKLMGLNHISNQGIYEILFILIPTILYLIFYTIINHKIKSHISVIESSIIFNYTISIIAFIFIKENVIFIIPSVIGTLFLFINLFKYNFFFNYILLLILISFTTIISYLLFTALSIGSISFVIFYILLSMWTISSIINIMIRND